MENSFYYFFSATPQVLAGVMALFSVFVIFKIQSAKAQLLGIGQAIINKSSTGRVYPIQIITNEKPYTSLGRIEMNINITDLEELKISLMK